MKLIDTKPIKMQVRSLFSQCFRNMYELVFVFKASAGYEQYYEPETTYSNVARDEVGHNGYQTTNFGPSSSEYAEP